MNIHCLENAFPSFTNHYYKTSKKCVLYLNFVCCNRFAVLVTKIPIILCYQSEFNKCVVISSQLNQELYSIRKYLQCKMCAMLDKNVITGTHLHLKLSHQAFYCVLQESNQRQFRGEKSGCSISSMTKVNNFSQMKAGHRGTSAVIQDQ